MSEKPWILGISASHNGACCLLHGSDIRVAIQEERLTGFKRARVYGARPALALNYCLQAAGITVSDLSMIVLSCQRSARAEENDIWMQRAFSGLVDLLRLVVPHHLAHAASAFAASGYERAAVLVADGLGSPLEDLDDAANRVVANPGANASEHLSLFRAHKNTLTPVEIYATCHWLERDSQGMWRFDSLGGMYSAVAQQIFGDPMEAGKVMGLAPYGVPRIPIEEFLEYEDGRIAFTNRVQRRFQHHDRWPTRQAEYRDLAASAQRALETAVMHSVERLHRLTGESNLCLAGGVALNSIVNQRLTQESRFERVFIIPAADDSGVAIGAAYLGLWRLGMTECRRQVRCDARGRTSTACEIETAIRSVPDIVAYRPADLLDEAVSRLRQGQIGGWFQGGSEFGPRALGQRSIICSPCRASAKDELNARVKFRESFRPFAPAVLAEFAGDWFEFGASPADSPFMLRVVPFRPNVRDRVPAVVHVDGSGRVQTVAAGDDGPFFDLIRRFYASTGVPMVLNTSMNIHGEPIAETPIDALWCLLGTGLDFCVIHDWLITKSHAFGSVLDYVPVVVAEHYTLRLNVVDHALRNTLDWEDAVTLRIRAPWGPADAVLPLRLLPLLSLVDGRRTGHALLAISGGSPSPQRIAHDLLLLRRMHVLQLTKADVSHD